jgi:MYXO-CTERM domain-containing protein
MRNTIVFGSSLLAALALAPLADAATIYVAPAGKADAACTREAPCTLTYAAENAKAGDTVILMDGTYHEQLLVKNSGNPSAWITFKADDCATPIIEGKGEEPEHEDDAIEQPTGVGSSVATYLRFEGLVSRYWNTGFGNGWTDKQPTSNGHWEIKYCIGAGNGRTGFTMYSTEGIKIQNSISAHNGSSKLHSWSSGFSLLQMAGNNNVVEGCISFENIDAEYHTDGNGFIADEDAHNVLFQNNVAFGNGGSCLRVTKSNGTKFINNTCFHNGRDRLSDNPSNPGEVYLTVDNEHQVATSGTYKNNIFWSTGTGGGAQAINPGNVSLPNAQNNIILNGGSSALFADPRGVYPDFTLTASATNAIAKGASGAPSNDVGFDPKCIVKRKPVLPGIYVAPEWAEYSIDYDYIKKIGGVRYCFNPKQRTATTSPDIGAYASGAVTKATPPTNCPGSSVGTGGTSGTTTGAGGVGAGTTNGGSSGVGGLNSSSGKGGTSSKSTGSAVAQGGAAEGGANDGGAVNEGGADNSTGGVSAKSTTSTSTSSGASIGGSGNATKGTATANSGAANSNDGAPPAAEGAPASDSGCGCRVIDQPSRSISLGALGLLGLGLLRSRRKRIR